MSNILPNKIKKRNKKAALLRWVAAVSFSMALILLVCAFLLAGLYAFSGTLDKELDKRSFGMRAVNIKLLKVGDEVKFDKLLEFAESVFKKSDKDIYEAMTAFFKLLPKSGNIVVYKMDYDSGGGKEHTFKIYAFSSDKDEIIRFFKKIKRMRVFDDVKLPISGISSDGEGNIRFNLSFKLSDI